MADEKTETKAANAPIKTLTPEDFEDLNEVFLLARGNNVAIQSEGTMANLINYKKDLFERIETTLKILEGGPSED